MQQLASLTASLTCSQLRSVKTEREWDGVETCGRISLKMFCSRTPHFVKIPLMFPCLCPVVCFSLSGRCCLLLSSEPRVNKSLMYLLKELSIVILQFLVWLPRQNDWKSKNRGGCARLTNNWLRRSNISRVFLPYDLGEQLQNRPPASLN